LTLGAIAIDLPSIAGHPWSGALTEEGLMSIIGTLVIGLLAGLVARFLMPGRDAAGFIVTMLLGVAGAFVASWIGQALGWYRAGQPAGFIGAVIGALLILLVYRLVARRMGGRFAEYNP